MFKLKKQRTVPAYTHSRTYKLLLIIVFNLCVGIAGTGYEVINKSEDLPFVQTAVALLLIGVILIAVIELFNNLKQEESYLEAKSVFLSVASHDISSPLTGINWAAQSMSRQITDPKQKERIMAIEQSSKSMLQTVDDALSITSLERLARQKVMPSPVDLLELIDGVINGFKLTAEQKPVKLARIGRWPSAYQISVDEKQFRRVVANLVSNAIKFATPNSTVELSFAETPQSWSLNVHNEGISISKEEQDRMFELHSRAKQVEKAGTKGVGFGLYLAKQIILRHNGDITIDSPPNHGVTFTITMPKNT